MSRPNGARAGFRNPDRAFRPAAFWFWHRIPTDAEIAAQLADFKAKGLGTVMIQARRALPLDVYLSPRYLAAYARAAAEMKRLDLDCLVYDEYCWMSGHGGGRTVSGAGGLRERHLFWVSGSAAAFKAGLTISNIRSPFHEFLGQTGRDWCYEDGVARWGDWLAVAAVPHPGCGDIGGLPSAQIAVAGTGDTACRISIAPAAELADDAELTVFVAARCLTSRMINYLLPAAAERFADKVYAPLVEACGGTARGVFFDHPYAGFYVWDEHAGDLGNSLLWDETLRDMATPAALLSLTRDVGGRTASLRAEFFAAYQARLHEAFFGTLRRWTRQRGLAFTGHELLTHVGAWGLQQGLAGIDPRSMPGVDYFGVDAYRTQTAVDACDYAPQLSARLGDSVARASGRKRCMIEQYSTGRETGAPALAGQWGLTAETFRAQAIRHLMAGARQILLHAVNVTDGDDNDPRLFLNPRFDFAPGFNFEPWWEDCPDIFEEQARLSAFLEEGEPHRPVALFYPLETLRAEAMAPACAKHFGWWAEALFEAGIGYDVIDESMLDGALGAGRYSSLVLPAVSTLAAPQSASAIAWYAAGGGGRVLASGPLPFKTRLEGEDAACRSAMDELGAQGDRLVWLPEASRDAVFETVRRQQRPHPDAQFAQGRTVSAIAKIEDGWRVALFNDQDTARRASLDFGDRDFAVSHWNPADGTVTPIGGDLRSIVLAPQQLVCLTLEPAPVGGRTARPVRPVFAATPSGRRVTLSTGWTLSFGDEQPRTIAVDRGWEVQGWPTLSGTGTYRLETRLEKPSRGEVWWLSLPQVRETVGCWVNGAFCGKRIAGQALFELAEISGEIELVLLVRNTGANRYYAGTPFQQAPRPSGLTAPPVLIAGQRGSPART